MDPERRPLQAISQLATESAPFEEPPTLSPRRELESPIPDSYAHRDEDEEEEWRQTWSSLRQAAETPPHRAEQSVSGPSKRPIAAQMAAIEATLRRALGLENSKLNLDALRLSKWVRPATKIAVVLLLLFSPLGDSLLRMAIAGLDSLSGSMSQRAAFQVIEEFPSPDDTDWRPSETPSRASFGSQPLSLHRSTMEFVDYHADFVCRLDGGSVMWAVRAADHDNYLAFRLSHSRSRSGTKYVLARYPVVKGQIDETERLEMDVAHLIHSAAIRVSVRLRGETVGTFINGHGVDFWRDIVSRKGGVGLWFEPSAPQAVQKLTVYGNEDLWGLILFGAIQTADRVTGLLSSALSDPVPPRETASLIDPS